MYHEDRNRKDVGIEVETEVETETETVETYIRDKFRTTKTMKVVGGTDDLAPDLLRFGRGRYRTLVLSVRDTDHSFTIPSHDMYEVVIGRSDPDVNFSPTIDLAPVGGQAYGVSRRHATLNNKNGLLFITDHATTNGTFVNDIRIDTEIPHVITNGDTVQFGNLRIWIEFVDRVLAT